MYSNDTQEIEMQLQKLKENEDYHVIFKSIQTYLNTKNIKRSLEIIYKLIKDNYCYAFQNILLKKSIVKTDTNSNSNNNIKKELDAKLDNIIFLSKDDRKHIQNTMPLISKINASYNENNIELYIISKEDDKLNEEVIRRIISKLFVLIDLFTKAENTTYHLYVWLSDLKKHKPNEHQHNPNEHRQHRMVSKKTFRSQHINSGATVHNLLDESVELFIWRKEEIEKVLLHEMIHTLKLDFMGYPEDLKRDIIEKFNIPSSIDLRLGEAYVETWAVLLNTIFVSFTNTKMKTKKQCKINSKEFFKLFAMEIFFTLYQSSKILRHFGYECITGCKVPLQKSENPKEIVQKLFEQETSVFSYYLIKAGILMNLGDFLKFCCKNNKSLLQFVESPVNYQELHKVFIESAKKNKLLNKMTSLKINLDNKDGNELLDNTMRMTLYELEL
jgi:hypothetical protein